jgi:hypothetical protein
MGQERDTGLAAVVVVEVDAVPEIQWLLKASVLAVTDQVNRRSRPSWRDWWRQKSQPIVEYAFPSRARARCSASWLGRIVGDC